MIPYVPALEDEHICKITELLQNDGNPLYVAVRPNNNALINECFPNVDEKIKKDGGRRVIGWQIWKTKHLIEAEFHAVWASDSDELLDITPKLIPCSKILFLEDKVRNYHGCQVDNVRVNISSNTLVNDLILVCETLFKIGNKGDRAYQHKLTLTGEELQMWGILNDMKQGLTYMLSQGSTPHQLCFCGGDKYRKCHGKFLEYVVEQLA